MFIQVPESVNKSLRNGISPRTEIHFPNSSLGNRHPRAILADDDRLRNEMFARRECDCGADGVTMPVYGSHWIPWRPPMFPSHESYRRSREVCNNLLLTPRSSPSKQSVTGVTESAKTAQKAVARGYPVLPRMLPHTLSRCFHEMRIRPLGLLRDQNLFHMIGFLNHSWISNP